MISGIKFIESLK